MYAVTSQTTPPPHRKGQPSQAVRLAETQTSGDRRCRVVVSDPAHHVVWKTVPDINCSIYEGSASGVSSRDRHSEGMLTSGETAAGYPPVDRITTFCQSNGSGEVSRVYSCCATCQQHLPVSNISTVSCVHPLLVASYWTRRE
ncbi:hypothetical protein Bbelb_352660 [Branchiostoma belcheri]|nr:hypothetical protein Bbelb_352660 [Branchiostoma belcheri]